jgi:hypothetical protein
MDLDEVLHVYLSFKVIRQSYYLYKNALFIIGVFKEGSATSS